MRHVLAGLFIAVVFCSFAYAEAPAVVSTDAAPCMEGPLAQFGRYVGDWKIQDEQLARDGSGWSPAKGARWIFQCIGDGTAVQDWWMDNNGAFGTNLRTYNGDTGKWEIVWAAKKQQGLMQISAEQNDEGDIVMNILSPKPPQPRRIIFFAPHQGGWNWVQQWSLDEGATWTDVYRIQATPWVE